jgi:CRP/FNR family transcriptional regulator, cyclic AMP receptor protein
VTATYLANRAWQTDGRLRQRRLLELDPELGSRLSRDRFAAAHRLLYVSVGRVPRGLWRVDGRLAERYSLVGLLITSGVLAREVVVGDIVSSELLGAGDVVAPWTSGAEHDGAREQGRWQALTTTEIALVDARLASRLAEYPEIQQALFARVFVRVDRLGALKALSDLNSVDQRLTGVFRQLGLRWGRVTEHGVIVPLALSHRLLAELIGARRPTVTTALKRLSRDGVVTRTADGTWLLSEQPVPDPEHDPPNGSPHRRRLLSDATLGADAHGHRSGHRFHEDARQLRRPVQ